MAEVPETEKTYPSNLHRVLAEATAMIPPSMLERAANIAPRLQQFEAEGAYAGWMEFLYKIGLYAEELGCDQDFPPGYWHRVAAAASAMRFPEFIPLAEGKAEGRRRRIIADVIAGIAVIHRTVGERWPRAFPERPAALDELVAMIAAVDPAYPGLLRTAGSTELARRFEADGCNVEPAPEKWFAVRNKCYEVLFALFHLVNADDFPESLAEERWSIVSYNSFELRYPGLFPRAFVWWWPE